MVVPELVGWGALAVTETVAAEAVADSADAAGVDVVDMAGTAAAVGPARNHRLHPQSPFAV